MFSQFPLEMGGPLPPWQCSSGAASTEMIWLWLLQWQPCQRGAGCGPARLHCWASDTLRLLYNHTKMIHCQRTDAPFCHSAACVSTLYVCGAQLKGLPVWAVAAKRTMGRVFTWSLLDARGSLEVAQPQLPPRPRGLHQPEAFTSAQWS